MMLTREEVQDINAILDPGALHALFLEAFDIDLMMEIARHPCTSEQTHHFMLDHSTHKELLTFVVANHPLANPAVLRRIHESFSLVQGIKLQLALARNPNTPPDILDGLGLSRYFNVELAVTQNPNAWHSTIVRSLTGASQYLLRDFHKHGSHYIKQTCVMSWITMYCTLP